MVQPNQTNGEKGYVQITLDVPEDSEEIVANFLIDHVTGGNGLVLEESDGNTRIHLYVKPTQCANAQLLKIKKFLVEQEIIEQNAVDDRVWSKDIREIDWVAEYQKKFESVTIDDVVIRSQWCDTEYPDKLVITLDPRMAFGTGRHETTQLCVKALSRLVKPRHKILDLGTGSAILAILAAKLGATDVYGLDIDEGAIENAEENIVLNGVENQVTVRCGSMEQAEKSDYYDIVVSNLIKDGIVELFDEFVKAVKPRGLLVLSGILTDQLDFFDGFFRSKSCPDFEITTLGEWACIVVRVGSESK
jgi:ribosomal protein L11 methyltransferase